MFGTGILRNSRQTGLMDYAIQVRKWLTPLPEELAIFHLTHQKARMAPWINRIFHALAYQRVILPEVESAATHERPNRRDPIPQATVLPGQITQPLSHSRTVRERPLAAPSPPVHRHPRSARRLVSAYFSYKLSHKLNSDWMSDCREHLNRVSTEEGLLFLLDNWLPTIATFQWSWVASGEELIKYEDLLKNDEAILERVLLTPSGCQSSARHSWKWSAQSVRVLDWRPKRGRETWAATSARALRVTGRITSPRASRPRSEADTDRSWSRPDTKKTNAGDACRRHRTQYPPFAESHAMLISHRKRFIYTKTVKTAARRSELLRAVLHARRRVELPRPPGICLRDRHHRHPLRRAAGTPGCDLVESHARPHNPGINWRDWNDYFKFCVVRNPFDAMVSAYRYFAATKQRAHGFRKVLVTMGAGFSPAQRDHDLKGKFERWLGTIQLPLDRNKYLIDGRYSMDHVIRYEALEAGIREVCQRLGVPFDAQRLPHLKNTKNRSGPSPRIIPMPVSRSSSGLSTSSWISLATSAVVADSRLEMELPILRRDLFEGLAMNRSRVEHRGMDIERIETVVLHEYVSVIEEDLVDPGRRPFDRQAAELVFLEIER